ncbi:Uncharacterised protein [Erysipelothrix rhusiopathiae]|uniref:Transposase n=1 Tax=Erysipelothrix rhusiopathiae ATCC 19414 TaxID=525280 RepID=E7FX19_ERYRH|nr:hypothetical protein HMPREF0357_10901 [Erysipelothrix rhusiopathiae ATCC 19414]VEH83292.1 Uncharacterised protein [Erysipelothrix rhusiopathiae]
MGLHKKSVYPLEVKLEAIRLRQEGYSVKEIQKLLDIKSESQVYIEMVNIIDFHNPLGNNIVMDWAPKDLAPKHL